MLAVALYYTLIASDRYVSESRFVVKSEGQRPSQISTLANLIQTTGLSAGQEQTNEVMDYVRSRNALADLSAHLNVRERYGAPGVDFLSRYPAPFLQDTFESLYRYYAYMVNAKLDPNSGLAVLTVQGYTPADAQAINARLLDLSERLVNRLNDKAQRQAIAENERLVAMAEQRVKNARLALAAYRNRNALLDPAKQASGVFEVSTRLAAEQAALNAQLRVMRQVAPANSAIKALESRVAALSAQIAAQNSQAVGSDSAISTKLTSYEALTLEQEFASQVLTVASTQLAQARSEAARQQFYLERVVEPNLPDMPTLPHRIINILTVAGILLGVYLVGWMLVVGILEHAPED
jgi:capsular polysaccharide transport system permease protein